MRIFLTDAAATARAERKQRQRAAQRWLEHLIRQDDARGRMTAGGGGTSS